MSFVLNYLLCSHCFIWLKKVGAMSLFGKVGHDGQLPFKLYTCCVSALIESLAVNALAIRDSPLCVIPLEVKSNIAREGRVGIADIKC